MFGFCSLFGKRQKKNKDEKRQDDLPASISNESTAKFQPTALIPATLIPATPIPATPIPASPIPTIKYLVGAEGTEADYANFAVVHGHEFHDPAMAAGLSTANIPVVPLDQRQSTEVLTNAKNTSAKFANFSIVGGNRYGVPQVNMGSASKSKEQEAALEPSLL